MAPGELSPATTGSSPAVAGGSPAPWQPPTCGPVGDADRPFGSADLELLDEVIAEAEAATGLRFSVYLGDLGQDTRGSAVALQRGLGADAAQAVLLAVSPGQRTVEVVTGAEAARRISDRAARLSVLSVVSSATDGDLRGALVNGVRTLADQAGTLPSRTGW